MIRWGQWYIGVLSTTKSKLNNLYSEAVCSVDWTGQTEGYASWVEVLFLPCAHLTKSHESETREQALPATEKQRDGCRADYKNTQSKPVAFPSLCRLVTTWACSQAAIHLVTAFVLFFPTLSECYSWHIVLFPRWQLIWKTSYSPLYIWSLFIWAERLLISLWLARPSQRLDLPPVEDTSFWLCGG